MKAMVLDAPGSRLHLVERALPRPGAGEVLLRVLACGVCRTDLHIVDGELPFPGRAVICGHEIVGVVQSAGANVTGLVPGMRVGVPWLGHSCGHCPFCTSARENLCDAPAFTGYQRDGGYATHVVAEAAFCISLDTVAAEPEMIAPLLCAGLIGWRCLKAVRPPARRIGLYGFGAAAHLIAQVAVDQGREVHAFTRPGDDAAQRFARSLGAAWAGGSDEVPHDPLDAVILFAPAGDLVPRGLRAVRKGGRVVCGGIHMSDIPSFPYELLWGEREIVSVANLTRGDAREFMQLVRPGFPRVTSTCYPLEHANEALDDLRAGHVEGAAVLVP